MKHHLPNPPSLVEGPQHRFLIFDAPNDDNLPIYINEFKKFNVKHLVRACDPTYEVDPLTACGIQVHDMPFNDGGPPTEEVVKRWLELVSRTLPHKEEGGKSEKETIGVHCVAGLGRAPVLVAIALIEGGMNPLDAVEFIRERRRGSINMKQIQYLKTYKVKLRGKNKNCTIM
eukprot:TRINITY_DN4671_c0_g1_i1.p1 TRINITY_DN4671_c0_g1~~TRINITY_DN4671_c0_g1_i1.p1  ORF type:complete len:173 (+),score=33.64 TRINITY_DN4671_c0_g1_i1:247-765(+)